MNITTFHILVQRICDKLTEEAKVVPFRKALEFEKRVREVAQSVANQMDREPYELHKQADRKDFPLNLQVDMNPPAQAFPDIVLGNVGIEVKFTESDTWRCIANSVLETNKVKSVEYIVVVYGKMGGEPEVRWGAWEKSVMHVRTSHVPRFEIEIGAKQSLFEMMETTYDHFSSLDMAQKMIFIRKYATSRLKPGEHLWWLDDREDGHTLDIKAKLYTNLDDEEKSKLRAEMLLLCPQIFGSGRARHKYDDAVMFMLTYHGVLAHQARDLFSAGSAAGVGGHGKRKKLHCERELTERGLQDNYMLRSLILLESHIREAASRLEKKLFLEYWSDDIPDSILETAESRLRYWLTLADSYAIDWSPSEWILRDLSN